MDDLLVFFIGAFTQLLHARRTQVRLLPDAAAAARFAKAWASLNDVLATTNAITLCAFHRSTTDSRSHAEVLLLHRHVQNFLPQIAAAAPVAQARFSVSFVAHCLEIYNPCSKPKGSEQSCALGGPDPFVSTRDLPVEVLRSLSIKAFRPRYL